MAHHNKQNVRVAWPKDKLLRIQVCFVSPVNHMHAGLPQVYTDVKLLFFFCMLNKSPEADILGLTGTDGPQLDNRFVFQCIQLIDFFKDCINTVLCLWCNFHVIYMFQFGSVWLKENSTSFIQSLTVIYIS